MIDIQTTIDGILNKRVSLEQPVDGYRVAIDTVLLAASVPAVSGDRILDLGCGVGGAMLALACRVAGISGVGVDTQSEFIDLCRRNIARNDFATGLRAEIADVTALHPVFANGFDHVLMNPPYHDVARHDVSENDSKRTANSDKDGDLGAWIGAATQALKTSGTLTIIHRADRAREIFAHLRGAFGDLNALSLLPKAGAEPKRIIIRARKDAVQSLRHCRPLILHQDGGAYTDVADAILRHAHVVVFNSTDA